MGPMTENRTVDATRTDRLCGKEVALKAIEPADVPFLYDIATSEANAFRWRLRGAMPSIQQFDAELFQGSYQQFTVVLRQTGEPVGQVVAYNFDPIGGHCSVAVLMAEGAVGQRLGRDALDTFVRYLFRTSPLRKIYAEVPAATVDGVEPSTLEGDFGARFRIEGRLTEHWYIDGRYTDMVIVAMPRAEWVGTGA